MQQNMAWWLAGPHAPNSEWSAFSQALMQVTQPIQVVDVGNTLAIAQGGASLLGAMPPQGNSAYPLKAFVPALHPSQLGSAVFRERHRLHFAYIAGAMANGIASTDIVKAMARQGMLGFFGSAGLAPARVEAAIRELKQELGDLPFGSNLIHSPNEPGLEQEVVDLYLREGVRLVSASAYLDLTLPLIHYRVKGIYKDAQGVVRCPNQIVAKVSRVEVARKFFAPPPEKMLRALVESGQITEAEATLAEHIPVAHDLTAEADSGGHTDNRSCIVLLPLMVQLRDEFMARYQYKQPLCVGLAGGIATPVSAAAAFSMGADFIVTGSINQACQEAGTSPPVRELLAQTRQADVTMAPAADMFEMGVQVQVLKRGTMFALRGKKLYELYRKYDSLQDIPQKERTVLERDYFRCSLEEAWAQTKAFFDERDPRQNERALRDPKHLMALVFRSYLGRASRWANSGEASRKIDYQIWCGPAMGAFNAWTQGSFLEDVANRRVGIVAMNLMLGASVLTRFNWLRGQGLQLPSALQHFAPLSLESIQALLG